MARLVREWAARVRSGKHACVAPLSIHQFRYFEVDGSNPCVIQGFRFFRSGVSVWAECFGAELKQRLPGQRKTQRDKLAVLVATMLHVRNGNLVELALGLPRESAHWDMGYQWISWFLANGLVSRDAVMTGSEATNPACRIDMPRACTRYTGNQVMKKKVSALMQY